MIRLTPPRGANVDCHLGLRNRSSVGMAQLRIVKIEYLQSCDRMTPIGLFD